jgi:hypothetical protein
MNHYMERPQISQYFAFFFYEPIYYMDPSVKFPQHNMLPGRFLGIARTTGDSFTFIIAQEDRLTGCVLHRSVTRIRCTNIQSSHADYQIPTLPSSIPEDPIADDHILDTNQPLNMTPDPRAIHHDISLPPDDTVEGILDSNISNTGDEIPYLVHLEPTQPTPLTDANTVYNHFDADYQCSHIEKVLSIENNPSTGTLFVKVLWKNQQESFLPIDVLKEKQPLLLAQYILQHPVKHTRSGFWNTWAHIAQREISSVQHKLRRIYSNITHERSFFLIASVPSVIRRSINPICNPI